MVIVEFMDMKSTKYGGLGRFMLRLMQEMPGSEFWFVFQNVPESKQMLSDFQSAGAHVVSIDTEGKRALTHLGKVAKLFTTIRPDIVHFHFANGFFFFAPLAKLLGIKYLVKTQHCCITTDDMRQVKDKHELSLKTRIASCDGKVYKLFDKIIMCGQYVRKQFVRVYGDSPKYEMVYFGVEPVAILDAEKQNLLRSQLNIQPHTKVICSVLFADPVKAPDVLIKALPYIKYEKFIVLLVGINDEIPYAQELHKLAKELHVDEKIRWIGITDHVNHYLSISDVYCQPSRSEALGLAVCEAKSAHLPVVGSNVGGLPEVSDCVFESENEYDLAQHLDELLSNDELRCRLSEQSYRTYTKYFDIKIGVEKYVKLYRGLVK